MRFALMIEPQQGMAYADILALAKAAEDAGFESMFCADHYTSFPGAVHLPTSDGWANMAGLARETSRITFGMLVSPVTFRIPGALIKMAMTVDQMSGGRLEVGVGAGWNVGEHAMLGIPFPSDRERVDMLEEELQILVGLWDQPDGWSFEGVHWQVRDAHLRPKNRSSYAPGNPRTRPNLIVGGTGKPRTLRLAARYADEYNMSASSAEECRDVFERLAGLCRDAGRDPSAVTRSVMVGTLIGRNETDLRERTERLLPIIGETREVADAKLADRQRRWLLGTPDQARAGLQRFVDAGVERMMVQTLLPWDLDYVKVLGDVFLG